MATNDSDEPRVTDTDAAQRPDQAADTDTGEAASRLPRDAAYWAARPTSGLSVNAVPSDAINLNVAGRHITSPIQGFGRMWRKQHRVRLAGANVTPAEVIATWKANFGSFWPKGNRFFGPLTGLKPGDVAVLNMSMPGRTRLSTGVMVMYADDESFTLMTPEGHIFAGWITFSSHVEDGTTVAQAEILMRASDPLFEIGMVMMGHRRENRFWEETLATLAAHFGVQTVAQTQVELIDPRYQWACVGNVRYNSFIRTGVYLTTTPVLKVVARVRHRLGAGAPGSGRPPGGAA